MTATPLSLATPRTDHVLVWSIPGRLPTYNEIVPKVISSKKKSFLAAHTAMGVKTKAIKKVRESLVLNNIHCQTPGKWKISHVHYEPDRRRDPDNFTSAARKIILDAIQPEKDKQLGVIWPGLIPDDGWKYIGAFGEPKWYVDRHRPRIEVKMERIG